MRFTVAVDPVNSATLCGTGRRLRRERIKACWWFIRPSWMFDYYFFGVHVVHTQCLSFGQVRSRYGKRPALYLDGNGEQEGVQVITSYEVQLVYYKYPCTQG